MANKKERVVVAMSGGVDSSVAAALLKDDGYDVVGITMQVWPAGNHLSDEHFGGCCSLTAVEDAKRVAGRLGIPHYVLNFRRVFKEKVIDNFIQEYKKGMTPNPCIRCNQFIKFDALLHKVRELNANFVATGHYARIKYNEKTKRWLLKKGIDASKDQSYVLYSLSQEQLKHILFPLGDLTKAEVRMIARKKGLLVADKRESQEICFIPDTDYRRFLKTQIAAEIDADCRQDLLGRRNKEAQIAADLKPGLILDTQGKAIGKHEGVAFYTVGQRRGLGISAREPLYVVNIDPKNNTIVVGPDEILYKNEMIVGNINNVSIEKLFRPVKANVKIRYRHEASRATVSPVAKGKVKVKFKKAQRAITPGQSAVFYNGDAVIGGGIIEKVIEL